MTMSSAGFAQVAADWRRRRMRHTSVPLTLIRVDGSTLDVTREDGPVDLAFAATPGIRRLISGDLLDGAIATGVGRTGLICADGWSGRRESNSRSQFGRLGLYH